MIKFIISKLFKLLGQVVIYHNIRGGLEFKPCLYCIYHLKNKHPTCWAPLIAGEFGFTCGEVYNDSFFFC